MTRWFLFLVVFIAIASCKKDSKYQGFSVTDSGLNYKIHTLGDTINKLHDGDFVGLIYSRYSNSGKVIETGEIDFNLLYQLSDTSKLMELLGMLSIGDSASYIKSVSSEDQLFSFKLLTKMSANTALILLNHPEFKTQISNQEILTVIRLLGTYQSDSIQYLGGMFVIHQVKGSGKFPVAGEEVVFHMESENAEGVLLESTHRVNTPFSYVLGDQDQVIEGVDYGIRRMKKGGQATLIIPSHLGYGESGSSTGIIKSFSTLVYQIDLLEVNRGYGKP
ncbi:MAG: hypothetical protein ACI85Q_001210 [Salibacteraceae bacterium]|jgi:FKBP-type peptidyl-prolyl cis-trans isomerase